MLLSSDELVSNVIVRTYPSLPMSDRNLLLHYLEWLIEIVASAFTIIDGDQLRQNDYQDTRWLLSLLVPFNNSPDTNSIIASIRDMGKQPWSNMQYNRCTRDTPHREYEFNQRDIDHNFQLLVQTIRVASHKLYPNWIDVLPYTLITYRTSSLYTNTLQKANGGYTHDAQSLRATHRPPLVDASNVADVADDMRALYVGDIYNTIACDLYENVRDVKWLMYDFYVMNTDETGHVMPLINILQHVFDINAFLADNAATDQAQQSFARGITNLTDAFAIEAAFHSNDNTFYFNDYTCTRIVTAITLNYGRHAKYIPIALDDEDAIDRLSVLHAWQLIDVNDLREFFVFSIERFKQTWYACKLLSNDKRSVRDTWYVNESYPELTCKNVYNFAKAITRINAKEVGTRIRTTDDTDADEDYIKLAERWQSIDQLGAEIFLGRLANNQMRRWFNITRIIKSMSNAPEIRQNALTINEDVFNAAAILILDIVFESLVTKGALTYFAANPRKSNLSVTPRDNLETKQSDVFDTRNSSFAHAYHFLTATPYDTLTVHDVPYFDYCRTRAGAWYKAYAYDWIAQLSFCHRFIHCRVIFVTGSTGIGKSTEVPKLFVYYLRAIDYKQTPRVICTQPRHSPTEDNADRVSTTWGVPIFATDPATQLKSSTNNYFVQMRHKDRRHMRNVGHASLVFVTDRILFNEINEPFYKITRKQAHERTRAYTRHNVYDVIMIDEAHEHNVNIDPILTLMALPLSNNNTLRLVILSATMDDDEARYRRFYRNINDNRKYPPDVWLQTNELDRIAIDRRLHIAPPTVSTRFPITDIYLPNDSEISVVQHIIASSECGDILVFQSGTAGIRSLVTEINRITPDHVIALPYYSTLSPDHREFVSGIANNLSSLHMPKTSTFATTSITNLSRGTAVYDRVILVATNIAEASITIPTLRYVIDTGTQKTSFYNHENRSTRLIETRISESSRLQRRGRVGRTAPGTVYYLYESNATTNNETRYAMTTNDLTDIFFSLIVRTSALRFDDNTFDTNAPKSTFNITKHATSVFKDIVIEQHYITRFNHSTTNTIECEHVYYSYYGNVLMYDYDNYEPVIDWSSDTFGAATMSDARGAFWIIHPEEATIERDMIGVPLSEISLIKVNSFWTMLVDSMYLYETMTATPFGIYIFKLTETIGLDTHTLGRLLAFGDMFGIADQAMMLAVCCTVTDWRPLLINPNIKRCNDVRDVLDIVRSYQEAARTPNTNMEIWGRITKNNVAILARITAIHIDNTNHFADFAKRMGHAPVPESMARIIPSIIATYRASNELINIVVLHSFSFNIARRIDHVGCLLSVYTPTSGNVFSSRNLCRDIEYVVYLMIDVATNDVRFIQRITARQIILNPLYHDTASPGNMRHELRDTAQMIDAELAAARSQLKIRTLTTLTLPR